MNKKIFLNSFLLSLLPFVGVIYVFLVFSLGFFNPFSDVIYLAVATLPLSIVFSITAKSREEVNVRAIVALVFTVLLYLFAQQDSFEFGIGVALFYLLPFFAGLALRLVSSKITRNILLGIITALAMFLAWNFTDYQLSLYDVCFTGDTKVLLVDGEKEIQNVVPGDVLLGFSEGAQNNKEVSVVEKITRHTTQYFQINNELNVTGEHPFYVHTTDQKIWVKAKDLKIGDCLVSLDNSCVFVGSIETVNGFEKVYNMHVDETENYYVILNGVPVLVHNKVPDIDPSLIPQL